jgi:hypothetical protein
MFELFELTTFKKVMKTLTPPIVQNNLNIWAVQASSSLDDSLKIKFVLIEGRAGSTRSDVVHRLILVSKAGEECAQGYVDKEEMVFADGVVLVGNSIMQDAHMLLSELFRIIKIGKLKEEGSALMTTLNSIDYTDPIELFDNSLTAGFPEAQIPSVLYL